jgi:23S rRNA (adenine-N6)-dimethyltransferase
VARPPRSGRHFLRPADAAAFVDAAGIRPGELVLDLGAGHGALTGPLLAAGARVVAVERDRRSADFLRERFPDARVVNDDLLSVPLPGRPYRVVANLPFATTAAAMRRLLASPTLRRADLVLQRGAAIGWSQRGARRFTMRLGRTIPAHRFVPPPSVDAAVLVLRRRN